MNYVDNVLLMTGRDERFDAILDILGSSDYTMNMAKWNALDKINFTGFVGADLVMLAFAAGRNFENDRLAKKVAEVFA